MSLIIQIKEESSGKASSTMPGTKQASSVNHCFKEKLRQWYFSEAEISQGQANSQLISADLLHDSCDPLPQSHHNKGMFSQSFPLKTDFLAGRSTNHLESSWHHHLGLAICKVSINLPRGQMRVWVFSFPSDRLVSFYAILGMMVKVTQERP